jgi:hypothetical protein
MPELWEIPMKTPWMNKDAWADEDHGDFWRPRKRLRKRLTTNGWWMVLVLMSFLVWTAIRAAVAA